MWFPGNQWLHWLTVMFLIWFLQKTLINHRHMLSVFFWLSCKHSTQSDSAKSAIKIDVRTRLLCSRSGFIYPSHSKIYMNWTYINCCMGSYVQMIFWLELLLANRAAIFLYTSTWVLQSRVAACRLAAAACNQSATFLLMLTSAPPTSLNPSHTSPPNPGWYAWRILKVIGAAERKGSGLRD